MTDLTEEWASIWAETVAQVERRSGVNANEWRIGGRKSKANPDGEDLAFWQADGLRQVEEYLKWVADSGWQIATMPDGNPGIEWEAEVSFAGTPVKLVIDAIYQTSDTFAADSLIVIDYKTGLHKPFGYAQLGLYASALEKIYGVRPKWGGYYMTRKATVDELIDLSPWGIEFFEHQLSAMNAAMATGYYPPNVSNHCATCSFQDYCAAVNGKKSSEYPIKKREGK